MKKNLRILLLIFCLLLFFPTQKAYGQGYDIFSEFINEKPHSSMLAVKPNVKVYDGKNIG